MLGTRTASTLIHTSHEKADVYKVPGVSMRVSRFMFSCNDEIVQSRAKILGKSTLHIDVPTTPVRDGYALFANAIPELARAQLEGTFAFKATLNLPSKAPSVKPRLEGMRVQGLGTDSLLARAVLAA